MIESANAATTRRSRPWRGSRSSEALVVGLQFGAEASVLSSFSRVPIGNERFGVFRYRLIDTAGSERGIVEHPNPQLGLGERVSLPDGREVEIVDVYDDEHGREGGVQATLAVDVE